MIDILLVVGGGIAAAFIVFAFMATWITLGYEVWQFIRERVFG